MIKKLFLILFYPALLLQGMKQRRFPISNSSALHKLALKNSQNSQKETVSGNTPLKRTKSTSNLAKLEHEAPLEGWFIPLDSSKVNRVKVPLSFKTSQIKSE